MHPVENIRGTSSTHLAGRRIVLGVCGSIGAVKAVELARELIRHGADVVPVMTDAATRILHPDALQFATGHAPITRLTGAVEHVSLLGQVEGRADLLLVAPATANTVSKMALGIDDSPVTTCATVAFGNKIPVVVAPAMHEVMLGHPIVADHQKSLVKRLGVTWVEPLREESKAKLADVEAIAEAVIERLASDKATAGPLRGVKALVVSGSTQEKFDAVRVLTNRSSGRTGFLLATELRRLGAKVTLWQGAATETMPAYLAAEAVRFETHADLAKLAAKARGFDQIWMPAAIGDYAPVPARGKVASGAKTINVEMRPLGKIIDTLRRRLPKAILVAFKAEASMKGLEERAVERRKHYRAQAVVANSADNFSSEEAHYLVVTKRGTIGVTGPKSHAVAHLVGTVLENL